MCGHIVYLRIQCQHFMNWLVSAQKRCQKITGGRYALLVTRVHVTAVWLVQCMCMCIMITGLIKSFLIFSIKFTFLILKQIFNELKVVKVTANRLGDFFLVNYIHNQLSTLKRNSKWCTIYTGVIQYSSVPYIQYSARKVQQLVFFELIIKNKIKAISTSLVHMYVQLIIRASTSYPKKTVGEVIRTIGVYYKQYSTGKNPVQQLAFFHILSKFEYAHL